MTDLFTTTQAAERLGVSRARVRQFVLAGRLNAQWLGAGAGRRMFFHPAELERFARLPRPPGRHRATYHDPTEAR